MPLVAGDKLGPFEIVGPLGAGGMGEVYRARDSKLKREVAIKVLPADVATDRERLARFQREAEVLASLNHPHIAQVYGIEENALVMELVEGEDLSQRIARGAIPIDEALPIAKQIAEALEAAHDAGIIHRDLKPANIKVRGDGTVKVLDFGLAKQGPGIGEQGSRELANSPTITSPAMTMRGVILGTAAYMSPEQAKGKAVDKRADIWAFGCVLYEMLTGKRAFKGDDVTDIITSVMRDAPDWNALPATTPPSIRTLLRRCLEKDPRKRAPHIAIARLEIDDAVTSSGELLAGPATTSPARGLSYGAVALIAAGCIIIAAGGTWMARRTSDPPKRPLIRTSFPLGELNSMRLGAQRHLTTITPDSSAIATVSNGVQFRRIDQLEWTAVPNTADATEVFASPDSRWFGFVTRSAIWKMPVGGGVPAVVAQMTDTANLGPQAATWSDDGRIYFTDANGIQAVAAGGGGSRETISAGSDFGSLDALPARGGIIYSRGSARTNPTIVMHTFDGRDDAIITEGLTPRFIAPDLLMFVRDNTLMGARFDPAGRRLVSDPVRLVESIARLGAAAQYDVSADGTLVYLPTTGGTEGRSLLTVIHSSGSRLLLYDVARSYSDPRLSPDGKRMALHLLDQDNDIWILDIARGAMTRLTFDPREDETPVWSPDGQWIAFAGSLRDAGQTRAVFRRRADGSGAEEILWRSPNHSHVTDWSPDGKSILIEVADPKQRSDIFVIDVATKTARPLIATPFSESSARVSPNGKWVAYLSEESGRGEIYAQAFPALGHKTMISVGGAAQPLWSRDGRTIYFRGDKAFASARIDLTGDTIQAASPATLFPDTFLRPQAVNHTTYEVFPDGSLLVFAPPDDGANRQSAVIAVFNWLDEVRATIIRK